MKSASERDNAGRQPGEVGKTNKSKCKFNPIADLFSAFTPAIPTSAAHQQKFTGTSNPRELRLIHALMTRPMPREHLDKFVGCSNGPDLVFRMRQKGLEIPCIKVPDRDRDGQPIRRGVFSFTDTDRKKIIRWNGSSQNGVIDPCLAGLMAMATVCAVLLAGVV